MLHLSLSTLLRKYLRITPRLWLVEPSCNQIIFLENLGTGTTLMKDFEHVQTGEVAIINYTWYMHILRKTDGRNTICSYSERKSPCLGNFISSSNSPPLCLAYLGASSKCLYTLMVANSPHATCSWSFSFFVLLA